MQRPLIIGLFGLCLLVLGAISAWLTMSQDDRRTAAPPSVTAPSTAQTASRSATTAPSAATPQVPVAPSFDVVRVNPSGDAVIAGRAAPNATVQIFDGDKELGTVTADARGEWVFVPNGPLPAGGRELSLSTNVDGKEQRSEQVVTLVVPERGSSGAPIVIASPRDGGASRVIQGPGSGPGISTSGPGGRMSLDTVDYDSAGALILTGKAPPGTTVQVYLDNKLVGRAPADADGRWQLSPEGPVASGQYTLRIDQLGSDGRVAMRIELPFSRAEFGPGDLLPGRVIVQPGESLWRIARRVHGRGMAYVTIYDANREMIRDPDLIYPGQVFSLSRTN